MELTNTFCRLVNHILCRKLYKPAYRNNICRKYSKKKYLEDLIIGIKQSSQIELY